MSDEIPTFYRVWFTIMDPGLSLVGVLANLLTPTAILNSYTPTSAVPPATETILLLDTVAGFLACLAFLQLVLLRARPNDLFLWCSLQFGIMLVDVAILGGIARALDKEERTDWKGWRAEEWTNVGITTGVLTIRLIFLASVGIGSRGKIKTV